MTIYRGALSRASDSQIPLLADKLGSTHLLTPIQNFPSFSNGLADISKIPKMREPIPWQKADLLDPIHLPSALLQPSIKALAPAADFKCGQFTVSLSHQQGEHVQLSIYDDTVTPKVSHAPYDRKGVLIFQTVKDQSFVKSGHHHLDIKEKRGSYDVKRDIREESKYQTIDHFEQLNDGSVIVQGRLLRQKFNDPDHLTRYRLCIQMHQEGHIDINARASEGNFIALEIQSDPDEKIFGFGEQFSHINLKGHKVSILVQEQGIGRGHRYITPLVNLVSKGSGGTDTSTSFPMPHFFTNHNRGLFLIDKAYSEFDLRDPHKISILFFENKMTARIDHFVEPMEHLERFSEFTGRMKIPPEWVHNGAILFLNPDDDAEDEHIEKLLKAGVKISAVWDQYWSGVRKTLVGHQVWWDWQVDTDRHPDLEARIAKYNSKDIRYLAYLNPMIVDREEESRPKKSLRESESTELANTQSKEVIAGYIKAEIVHHHLQSGSHTHLDENSTPKATSSAARSDASFVDPELGMCEAPKESLYKIAAKQGYLVKKNGKIVRPGNTTFNAGLIDFTNPAAREWFKKEIMQRQLIDRGVSGWMWDYGESYPFGSSLHSGLDSAEQHNVFPELLAQTNYEAIQESGRESEILTFQRSGFTQSLKYTIAAWESDQMTIGPGPDGMESAFRAMLSGGLSGITINHSDTGGFTSISLKTPLGIIGWARESWLLQRWGEMNMFSSLLRYHPGVQPLNNSQIYDQENIPHAILVSEIYCALTEYRKSLFKETQKGWPVVRHTMLHYFNDPNTHDLESQGMLGREFIFAPIFRKSQTAVSIYLPKDQWVHLWSGKEYDCSEGGREIKIKAPLGQPAVFYLKGSKTGEKLRNMVTKC